MSRVAPAKDLWSKLSALALSDADGVSKPFSARVGTTPTVLAHLRHFGCLFCRQRAATLAEALPELSAQGAQIIAVGTGTVAEAKAFKTDFKIPYTLLADDGLRSYQLVGAKETSLAVWAKPTNIAAAVSAVRAGHMQGKIGNHQRYQGATHVIVPPGAVVLAWLNEDLSKDAPLELIRAALDEL